MPIFRRKPRHDSPYPLPPPPRPPISERLKSFVASLIAVAVILLLLICACAPWFFILRDLGRR
jgi:uncharacterized RDD family membrane protein YckC